MIFKDSTMAILSENRHNNVMGFGICKLTENIETNTLELICLSMNGPFLEVFDANIEDLLHQPIQLIDYDLLSIIKEEKPISNPFYKKKDKVYRIEILKDSVIPNQYTLVTENITAYLNLHESHMEASVKEAKKNFHKLLQSSPVPMIISTEHALLDCNQAVVNLLGFDHIDEITKYGILGISPGKQKDDESSQEAFTRIIHNAIIDNVYSFEWTYMKKDGSLVITENTLNVSEVNGEKYFQCTLKDITAIRTAQKELLLEQQRMIDALSIPITPIFKKILLLPLIGSLSENRVNLVIESALQKIANTQSKVLILDVSGAHDIDVNIASRQFRKLTAATKLMGCITILSGMPPQLAEGLISLNLDLSQIISLNNLQAALQQALIITNYEGINLQFKK